MQPTTGGEAVLTDLCAICHVNPLKYTCPRCGIHTCSLPCVKRHKQWAQCSGVRDPAEYRRRAELATPSSIDKDYNFITKVERTLQRADDIVVDKAIDLSPARTRWHVTKSKLEQEIETRRVRIIKAPKGLSRSKQNKTHWAGNAKCIMWTIEWISPDGQKQTSNTHETKRVDEAYTSVFGKKGHGSNLKRKRAQGDSGNLMTAISRSILPSSRQVYSERENLTADEPEEVQVAAGSGGQPPAQSLKQEQVDTAHDNQSKAVSDSDSHAPQTSLLEPSSQTQSASISATANTLTSTSFKQLHHSNTISSSRLNFYLHRPNTEARFKCLIPIPQTLSLREALENRTLLEFPTIYVKTESPEELREPFITEDEYTKRHGVDIPINVGVPAAPTVDLEASHRLDVEEGELIANNDDDDDEDEDEAEGEEMAASVGLSETKVLEVLAKDLG